GGDDEFSEVFALRDDFPGRRARGTPGGGGDRQGKVARYLCQWARREGRRRILFGKGRSGEERHAWYHRRRKAGWPSHSAHLQRGSQPVCPPVRGRSSGKGNVRLPVF